MTRISWTTRLLTVAVAVVVVAAAAAAPSPGPYPVRIDFPSTEFDAAGVAVPGTGYSPEGIAVSGDTFYAGSTQTGEIIKGNLRTGEYQRNWVPASPSQPSELHRQGLGLLVDDHNRLWFAGSYGMACGGNNQPVCPAGVTSPAFNYGVAFVYDATTGAQLAQYTLTAANAKTINDMTISGNAVYFSNTTAPSGVGSEVQFKLQLGPGGALPPGDVPATAPRSAANPAVTNIPTPGFTGADGIDTLPNGNPIINSVSGASNGQMIVIDTTTLAVTPVTVAAAPTCIAGQCAPPLLSGDGVALDGNTLYYPENRADTATPPGSIAAVKLMPPNFTTAQIVARLNNQAGLPRLRNPANIEQLGHFVYAITRELVPNPVTGVVNVNQFYIARIEKIPPPCSTSVSAGPLTVRPTQAVCLGAGAIQAGPVTVQPGGTLYLDGATVAGPITASGAVSVHVCGSRLAGPLTVSGATGIVVVGGDAATGPCAGNFIVGPVTLTGNFAGVEFNGNTVIGPVQITGNTGALPPPDVGPVHAEGNSIIGPSNIQH